MVPGARTLAQLSQVISQVTAPAFLLGAVAGFTSILTLRLHRILDRAHVLNAINDDDTSRAHLKTEIPILKRRAQLVYSAIFFATMCAIVTSLLVVVAFASAILNIAQEYGVAILFVIALAFFIASLVNLLRETRLALHEIDRNA